MSCISRSKPSARKRAQVQLLEIVRRGLDAHLELIVVLQPERVVAVAAVGRPARGLHVRRAPGLGADRAQKRRRMKSAGTHFHVVGLQDDAALLRTSISAARRSDPGRFAAARVEHLAIAVLEVRNGGDIATLPARPLRVPRRDAALHVGSARLPRRFAAWQRFRRASESALCTKIAQERMSMPHDGARPHALECKCLIRIRAAIGTECCIVEEPGDWPGLRIQSTSRGRT